MNREVECAVGTDGQVLVDAERVCSWNRCGGLRACATTGDVADRDGRRRPVAGARVGERDGVLGQRRFQGQRRFRRRATATAAWVGYRHVRCRGVTRAGAPWVDGDRGDGEGRGGESIVARTREYIGDSDRRWRRGSGPAAGV